MIDLTDGGRNPLPWRVRVVGEGTSGMFYDIVDNDGFNPCIIDDPTATQARLFAAAPRLLAVCQMVAEIDDGDTLPNCVAEIRDILREIEGP